MKSQSCAEGLLPEDPIEPCSRVGRAIIAAVRERANHELKRRGRVVQVFPGGKSLIRMMGAVFAEMDEDRVGHRQSNDDSIGRAEEGTEVNAPAHAYGGAAAEHAARIIALVVAYNPVPGGKAT